MSNLLSSSTGSMLETVPSDEWLVMSVDNSNSCLFDEIVPAASGDNNLALPVSANMSWIMTEDEQRSTGARVDDQHCDKQLDILTQAIQSIDSESSYDALPPGKKADMQTVLDKAGLTSIISLDQIRSMTLRQLKKYISNAELNDTLAKLIIGVRKRCRNTEAVRSSRRRRRQYLCQLREELTTIQTRNNDAREKNRLLRQLHTLWLHLVREIQTEIAEEEMPLGEGNKQQQQQRWNIGNEKE